MFIPVIPSNYVELHPARGPWLDPALHPTDFPRVETLRADGTTSQATWFEAMMWHKGAEPIGWRHVPDGETTFGP